MRHKRLNKRFGRNSSQRKQLLNSLVRALFISHSIETTAEKAKEARRLADKLVTLAKKARLSDIRAINDIFQDKALTRKIIDKIAPLFKERSSGYTRIVRSGFRRGDGAPLAILELTDMPAVEKKLKKPKKTKSAEPASETENREKEKKPAETKPAKEKKEPPKKRPLPPKPKERPKEVEPETKEEPKEKKPLPKKGLFGKFKGFFKKED